MIFIHILCLIISSFYFSKFSPSNVVVERGHFRAGKWVHVSSLLLSRWVTLDNNDYHDTHLTGLFWITREPPHATGCENGSFYSVLKPRYMSYSDTKSSHRQFTKKMSLNWFKISWTSHQLQDNKKNQEVERTENMWGNFIFLLLFFNNWSLVNLQSYVSFRGIFLSEDCCHNVNLLALWGPPVTGDSQGIVQRAWCVLLQLGKSWLGVGGPDSTLERCRGPGAAGVGWLHSWGLVGWRECEDFLKVRDWLTSCHLASREGKERMRGDLMESVRALHRAMGHGEQCPEEQNSGSVLWERGQTGQQNDLQWVQESTCARSGS